MGLIKLCVVGAGSIGRAIIRSVAEGQLPCELVAVCDNNAAASREFLDSCGFAAVPLLPLADCLALSDVAVEAAAAEIVPEFTQQAHRLCRESARPAHIIVMSVGGLLDVDLEAWRGDASAPVLHVPAGAIGGLEALQALAIAGLDEVTLTTRKPPAGLGQEITAETVLFEGPAEEVFRLFPKNVNVAIALSLAGLGPKRTMVRLLADPAATRNSHSIHARGPAGELSFTSQNEPFPDNPRTSYLAALSAIALLRRIASRVQVG